MRASVFIATSVDGFIARTNGGLDWLPANGGEPHGYDEFIATVDAIVMASAASRGDLVYTSDVADLERLRAYFPTVRVLAVGRPFTA